jgi:hypothetical protein
LLKLVRTRNAELHCYAILCNKFADKETAPYFRVPSSFFNFAKSLPPCLMNRFTILISTILRMLAPKMVDVVYAQNFLRRNRTKPIFQG